MRVLLMRCYITVSDLRYACRAGIIMRRILVKKILFALTGLLFAVGAHAD